MASSGASNGDGAGAEAKGAAARRAACGLSRKSAARCADLLSRVPRDVTIVMIEHDMDSALAFAERITLLHYGEVIVEGTRAEVVADPRTKEVYLGE
jgi:branched-chain amino acid transport system ATP-binding protein